MIGRSLKNGAFINRFTAVRGTVGTLAEIRVGFGQATRLRNDALCLHMFCATCSFVLDIDVNASFATSWCVGVLATFLTFY